MTDFLTRLAQRTLGLVPVVQPRLASCYAPVDEVRLDMPSTLSAVPQPVTGELKAFLNPTNLEIINEINNLTSRSLIESSIIDSPQVPQQDSAPLTTPVQPAAAPASLWVNNAPLLPQQSLEIQVTIAPTTNDLAETQQFTSPSSVIEPSTDPLPQPFKSSQQPPQIRTAQPPLVPPALVNLSPPPLETAIEREPTIALPLVTLEAQTPPHFTSTLRQSAASLPQPSQATEQTVIEVRIGRVEVRDSQPTPAKPRAKTTPATPALSLSDYLNRRGGGKL